MSDSKKHPAVGIDLGTTFSAVAFIDSNGRPETIRSAEGDLTTPSAVFFDRKSPIIGIEAVEAGLLEPERLALYAKRDVGEDQYEKSIRGETFPPEVIQALVLKKLKSDAELKLGEITKAVVTVPAFFNEPCRKATQDAGRLAGLEVLDIINEPTAAAITYGVQQGFLNAEGKSEKLERVLVYDLGGGTFDVTVMEISEGNYNTIATAGDVYLGGIDWDRRIVDFIAEKFEAEHGVDPRDDPTGEQELVRKANQTKHALTQRESVSIAFGFDGNRLRTELTQEDFAKLTDDLVERTIMTVQLVLDDSGLAWSDLTRLILVGGSTRMPMIRDELYKQSGFEVDRSLSPDEAVSHGAAIYASMLLGHASDGAAKVSVSNVNSHDLGILAVDPKTGKPRRQVMIPRNSSLPAQMQMRFRTHQDNQSNVKIEVVEGGDDQGVNATKIGKCIVDDLPPKTPKGTSVDVVFDYSQDGRLKVSANLPDVNRTIQMTMDRAAGLSSEEFELWQGRINTGFADPDPATIVANNEDEPDFTLVDEEPKQAKPTPKQSPSPFAIVTDGSPAKPKPAAPSLKTAPNVTSQKPNAAPKKLSAAKKPVVKAKHVVKASSDSDSKTPPPLAKPKLKKPVVKKKPPTKLKPASQPISNKTAGNSGFPQINVGEAPVAKPGPANKGVAINPNVAGKGLEIKPPAAKAAPAKKLLKKPAAGASPLVAPEAKQAATDAVPMAKIVAVPGIAPVAPVAKPQSIAQPKPSTTQKPSVKKPVATKKPAAKTSNGPKLDLGDQVPQAKVSAKPGEPDFSQLMGLGGGSSKKTKISTPVIVTDGPSAKKKKGDWKSRGKKLSSDQDDA